MRIDGDCWRWTGYTNAKGYGQIRWAPAGGSGTVYVHRAAHHVWNDPSFPLLARGSGIQIDHVATKCVLGPPCINPEHLEPVTNRVNSQRTYPEGSVLGAVERVSAYTQAKTWTCHITIDGRARYIGSFHTPHAAGRAYDAACIALGLEPRNCNLGLTSYPSDIELARVARKVQRYHQATKQKEAAA